MSYELSDRDKIIKEWVLACRRESEEGRITQDTISRDAWRAYFNEHDFRNKDEWQTQVSVPLWAMGVDQLSGAVKQAMQKAARLFSIEVLNPNDPVEVARASFVHDLMHLALHDAKLPRAIGDGCKVGAITNHIILKVRTKEDRKVYLAPEMEDVVVGQGPDGRPILEARLRTIKVNESRPMLDIPVLNPRHVYLDPLNRELYRQQVALKDISFLQSDAVKFWNRDAVAAALEESDAADRTEDEQEKVDMLLTGTRNPMRSQVRLAEQWSPIYDKKGRKVSDNKWVILLNDKYVALESDYPFWHGGDPFVRANFIRIPFTPHGKLLYQHVGPIGRLITELVCMGADQEKFSTLGLFGIDNSALEDPDVLIDGVFPGMTLQGTGGQVFQQAKFQGVDTSFTTFLSDLRQLYENGMANSEFLSGAPSIRGRATATEVNAKTSLTSSFVEALTADMEEDGVEPVIVKAYWNVMQFFNDWSDPRMQALAQKHGIDPGMLGRDPVMRYKLLKGAFKFHVATLSAVIRRAEMMERLMRLVEALGARPEFAAMMGTQKLQSIMDKILQALDFDDLVGAGNQMPGVVLPPYANVPNMQPMGNGGKFMVPPPQAQGQDFGTLFKNRGQ